MMAYKTKLVVAVKCNGKVLREREDGKVYIPFGSEYSILIKNLNTVKSLVDVDIDGSEVFNRLIVHPNREVELERFQDKNAKFKFIKKTQQISDYRGDKLDDGIIRVQFKFEKKVMEETTITNHHHYHYHRRNHYYNDWWFPAHPYICNSKNFDYGLTNSSLQACYNANMDSNNFLSKSSNVRDMSLNEDGITVAGSHSSQNFVTGYIGELETTSDCIILKLCGRNKDLEEVKQPLFVNKKLECPTCGTSNKSNSSYCSNCGTNLSF